MNHRFKNISTLFFDGAGTLFHVRGSVGKIYAGFALKYGVDLPSEALEQRFRRAFQAAPPLAFPGSGARRIEMEKLWWHDLVSAVFKENGFDRFDKFFDELFEYFRGSGGWQLYPEVRKVLYELKKRGYRLEVISNFDSRIYDVCHALRIEPFLDRYHLSSQIGSAKPDDRIFNYALIKCGIHPWQAVHIGDHLNEDVEGAMGAGLHAVWLNRSGMRKKEETRLKTSSLRPDRKKGNLSYSKVRVPSGALHIANLTELLDHFPPKTLQC